LGEKQPYLSLSAGERFDLKSRFRIPILPPRPE
jgi:hypothetical protein